ncbi:unannotated protein [freshwater metagenome]|uniref:histidine kinase n=1 Tax=freshwater metagenome TaxID=449393 RepID=A0A6J7CIY1_9ZZZZ|nr:PAS domain S-box protein [Actinomycetota bacterium]
MNPNAARTSTDPAATPTPLESRTRRLALVLCLIPLALGLLTSIGWVVGSGRASALWLAGTPAIPPGTGIAFVLAGAALVLLHLRARSVGVLVLAGLSMATCIIGLVDVAIGQHANAGYVFSIHAADTSVVLSVLGIVGLLLVAAATVAAVRPDGRPAQALGAAALLLGLSLTLVAIETRTSGQPGARFTQLSGAALLLLGWSAVLATVRSPPLSAFFRDLPSAAIARRTLALLIIGPALVSPLLNILSLAGLFDRETAHGLITAAVAILALLVAVAMGVRTMAVEERMAATASRVRELYEEAPTGYFSLDGGGMLIEANMTLCAWLGLDRETLIGTPLMRYVTPETLPALGAALAQLENGESVQDAEFDLLRAHAAPLATGMRADRRRSEDGLLDVVRATLFDVTQQRAAERERRAADTRYRRIVETATEGIWMLDEAGRTSFVNPYAAELLGHDPTAMIGRPLSDFADGEGTTILAGREELGIEGSSFEMKFQRADGSDLWVLWASSQLLNDDGTMAGWLGMFTDISARREAERLVRDNQRRLQELIDENPSGMALMDLDLRFWLVNRAYAQAVGRATDELVGLRARDVFAAPQGDEIEALQRRALEQRCPLHEERRMAFGSVSQTRLNTYFPLFDESGEPYAVCLTTTDVSALKAMEAKLAELNRDLEARVESRTRELQMANADLANFASTVAHDLRAPLRTIHGFSSILQEEYGAGLPDEGQRYLGLVSRGALEMSQLIDDLLTFARTGRQEVERIAVDPAVMIDEAISDLEAVEPTAGVDLVIAPDLPACLADPRLLRIVFQNLIANALKFTRGREHRRVEIAWEAGQGGEVIYCVKDNGIGFDPSQAERIFGMFQRLHSSDDFEGTGIGLAIVERVVHRHGGRVTAEGVPGGGATFRFTLGPEDTRQRLRGGGGTAAHSAPLA